jgi:hypothetical protein
MKTQDAVVVSVAIFAVTVFVIAMCWLGAMLFIDANTAHWEPVPGTTTYEWQ